MAITYLDLTAPDKTIFRVGVTDEGAFKITKMSVNPPIDPPVDPDPDPTIDQAFKYKGLIINQVYGGGSLNCNDTPVSHSFIELYNTTSKEIDLSGLSLQYARTEKLWEVFPLSGKIPSKCSYTIRCGSHSSINADTTLLKITKYDSEWPIALSDKGFKLLLLWGKKAVDVVDPYNSLNNPLNPVKCFGYIDLIGVGPFQELQTFSSRATGSVVVDGFEKALGNFVSKTQAVHRIDFADTDNNSVDLESLDYTVVNPAIYRPRTVSDGAWDLYFDKSKVDPNTPNMLNMTFGTNPNNSRCFTWHTSPTVNGSLLYKKQGDATFITVESVRETITHPNVSTVVHRVKLKNLQPGTYVYKVGETGKWSPEYTFSIKTIAVNEPFEMLQITDQQGWSAKEYSAWQKAWNYIKQNETFDFLINTGDMSQNGERIFEWLDYFNGAKTDFASKVCMSTVGNNDMIKATNESKAFNYYYTFDGNPYTSVYSFDYGPVHFVCLNSNELVTEQTTWVRNDLNNTTKPWKVVYTHDGPYTVDRKSKLAAFDKIFEECGVQLVICGHRHYYMRSKPMFEGKVNADKGIYYVMSQATGYKSGEVRLWQDWYEVGIHPQAPCYVKWEITPTAIVFKSYEIQNILPIEIPNGLAPAKRLLDTLTINHK